MAAPHLKGQLALITGATGGIGLATCQALAALGLNLAVHYNSDADGAARLVADVKAKYGVDAAAFQADLSQYEATRTLHAQVVEKLGAPSILFNNAGVIGKGMLQSIQDVTMEEFETTWRTNCATAFLLTQLCMPAMEKQRFGRVIFCSSVAGFTGGIVGPHYASSKAALHGLVHWLSGKYCSQGITVNGVAPALIAVTKLLAGSSEAALAPNIPVGRLGRPEEVAETVVWMVKTAYVTNKVIGVDGGYFVQ